MNFKIKYIDLNSQHKLIVKELNRVVSKVFKNSAFILRQNVHQFKKKEFVGSEKYYESALSLPIYYDLKLSDQTYIIRNIIKFFD